MSKQVITLAQLQAAMAANACTAEAVLAQYDCPEYIAPVATVVEQPAAVAVATQPTVETVAAVIDPAVVAGFNIMAFAQTAVPAAGSERRTPAWECTIEELRERVNVRDLQTPGKKDELNAKLRLNLAPVYAELTAYGLTPEGTPITHFVVPRQHEEVAKAKMKADVMAGLHDAALLDAAQRCKASSEKKAANKLNKAPQDTAGALAALAALEAAQAPAVEVGVQATPTMTLDQAAVADLGLAPALNLAVPTLG